LITIPLIIKLVDVPISVAHPPKIAAYDTEEEISKEKYSFFRHQIIYI